MAPTLRWEGKRRTFARRSTRRARIEKAKRRVPRINRLKPGNGKKPRTLFTAGALPEAAFAAEVWGMDNVELGNLRGAAAATMKPSSKGRSRSVMLSILGDPVWQAAVAPVIRYAKEVWRAALSINEPKDENEGNMSTK